jgi:hypothetical protein
MFTCQQFRERVERLNVRPSVFVREDKLITRAVRG